MSRATRLIANLTGVVFPFAGSAAPDGWLMCYGQAVSRATYGHLFSVIGTTYGAGNGTTTFNLPALRGQFLRGLDGGRGIDAGRALGSLQDADTKSHTHTGTAVTAGAHTHTGTAAADGGHTHTGTAASAGAHTHGIPARGSDGSATNDTTTLMYGTNKTESTFASMASAGAHTHTLSIAATADHTHTVSVTSGGGHTHDVTVGATGGTETRPTNVAMNYIIHA